MILRPNLRIARMLLWHYGEYDHRGDQTTHGQCQGDSIDQRYEPISQADNSTTRPVHDLKHNEHLPRTPVYLPMRKQEHCDSLVPKHRAHRRGRQEPCTRVQVPREKSSLATTISTQHRSPVIYTTGGGHGRCEFSEGGGDGCVEDADEDEAVDDGHGATILERSDDCSTC